MYTSIVLLAVVLTTLIAALWARGTLVGRKPSLRSRPGESEKEARLLLLGTYRAYTWALWITVVGAVISRLHWLGEPAWMHWLSIISGIALLPLAHALYWRLGYDSRRWVMVLGHLSGLFGLTECYAVLQREVLAVAPEAESGVGS